MTQSTANPREVPVVSCYWNGNSEAESYLGLFSICVVNDLKLLLPYLRSSDRSKVNDWLGRYLGNVGVSHAKDDKHKAPRILSTKRTYIMCITWAGLHVFDNFINNKSKIVSQ